MAGVDLTHIPYQGPGPALTDVLDNQVPNIFDNVPSASGHITSGSLKALGVTTAKRAPGFPDVPTIAETLPKYETDSGAAPFAPAGTPLQVIAALNEAALAPMPAPEVIARTKEFFATIVESSPDDLGTHVTAEMAKREPVVTDAQSAWIDPCWAGDSRPPHPAAPCLEGILPSARRIFTNR